MLSVMATPFRSRIGRVIALAMIFGLAVGVACSGSDIAQEDLDAAKNLAVAQAELETAKADLAAAESELSTTKSSLSAAQVEIAGLEAMEGTGTGGDGMMSVSPVPVAVIQTGQSAPAPAGSTLSGWATEESERGGLFLVAQYDSSGPDAWDPAEHPLIYVTSDGTESSSPTYDSDADYFSGFDMVDAYTKEPFQSVIFTELEGMAVTSYPHGVGISPDGKWGYVGFGLGDDREGHVAIVNMRTLKIDKLLKQESPFEGGTRSQRLHHIQAWTDHNGVDRVILQWGFGANGGPHHILSPNDDNEVWRAITYDDVKPMGHPFTTPSPDGRYVYISMGANWIRSAHAPTANVAKYDIETGTHEVITGTGHHPIGITHTQDGRYTYVVDGHASLIFKIDNEINEVIGETSAGVGGPYGIALNWDETRALINGKGEGSHNLGGVMGVLDTTRFRQARDLHQMPIFLGGSASSVDHVILHPDPEVNEMWVSNMNGWETIVVDLETFQPTDWIPTIAGGNTHNGAFVSYTDSWDGTLESDMGGPKSVEMKAAVVEAVQAQTPAVSAR